jgi:hypothetical protein
MIITHPIVKVVRLMALVIVSPNVSSCEAAPVRDAPVPVIANHELTLIRSHRLRTLIVGNSFRSVNRAPKGLESHIDYHANGKIYHYIDISQRVGRYIISDDRVCQIIEHTTDCFLFFSDVSGNIWRAKDTKMYPLRPDQVIIDRIK